MVMSEVRSGGHVCTVGLVAVGFWSQGRKCGYQDVVVLWCQWFSGELGWRVAWRWQDQNGAWNECRNAGFRGP